MSQKILNIYVLFCNNFHVSASSFAFVINFWNCKETLWTPCKIGVLFILMICFLSRCNVWNISNDLQLRFKCFLKFSRNADGFVRLGIEQSGWTNDNYCRKNATVRNERHIFVKLESRVMAMINFAIRRSTLTGCGDITCTWTRMILQPRHKLPAEPSNRRIYGQTEENVNSFGIMGSLLAINGLLFSAMGDVAPLSRDAMALLKIQRWILLFNNV